MATAPLTRRTKVSWTPRERVLAAFAHEEADRVPIDFGGAEFTSIIFPAYDKLKAYLGMDHETKMMSRLHSVVHPHEDILKLFGVDTRNVFPGNYEGGHQVDVNWKRTVGTDDCHFLHVDGVFFGEDLGTQDGCMFDPDSIYAQILKPRHRRMVEAAQNHPFKKAA